MTTTQSSDQVARAAAEEIACEVNGGDRADHTYPPALVALLDDCSIANEKAFAAWLETIILKRLRTAAVPETELVDEVQRRMDQLVEAAVEWHQAGREGAEWFEAAEKLSAAIDSLLELRSEPVATAVTEDDDK